MRTHIYAFLHFECEISEYALAFGNSYAVFCNDALDALELVRVAPRLHSESLDKIKVRLLRQHCNGTFTAPDNKLMRKVLFVKRHAERFGSCGLLCKRVDNATAFLAAVSGT